MGWYAWSPYVPVAKKREEAQRKLEKLKKQGQSVSPVTIEGRTIAKSFWGKSWCENLERYSDYANRLPRGRSYVRNGSVLHLEISRGEVTAMVNGSDLYKISVKITPVAGEHWSSICGDCAGSVGSLIELLQGKLSKSVMERVCRKGDGLFPAPHEITLSCSCPDWADMCKHVAAVMYGIGARLDKNPELLFALRAVDENELIASAGKNVPLAGEPPASARVLVDDDISALFGIDMGGESATAEAKPSKPSLPKTRKKLKAKKRTQPAKRKAAAPAKILKVRKAALTRNVKTRGKARMPKKSKAT